MKLFTPIFILAVCLATYMLYISPTYSAVEALSTQKNNYEQVLSKAKDVAAKRDEVLASYNAISPDDLSRLSKIVPATFDTIDFANNLNTIAARYGLSINSIQVASQDQGQQVVVAVAPSQYQTNTVTFSMKAEYAPFVSFMTDLESGLDLVDVTGMSIKSDQNTKGVEIFDFSVTVKTYSLN